jgi:6-phosphofructokinase 2
LQFSQSLEYPTIWQCTNRNIQGDRAVIYTLTLNPALDRALWVKQVCLDTANRVVNEERYAAGKGIDVSKVLTSLGTPNTAMGFVGGFAGEELEGQLLNAGVSCSFVRISGETRTNIIVNEQGDHRQVIFNAKGPKVHPYELMRLIRRIENLKDMEFLAISGSLPAGVHPVVYRQVVALAKSKGAMVLLDADGEALKAGVEGLPDAIKPNEHELAGLVGKVLTSLDETLQAAMYVLERGIPWVLISLGSKGALLVKNDLRLLAVPPKVQAKNTVGAGDSFVAGFLHVFRKKKDPAWALKCAVAAGTATTLMPGTAICTQEAFLEILPKVEIKPV